MSKLDSALPVAESSRPRALLLAPELPYPTAGGGALRSASLLEFLAQHFDVDVILFREPDAQNPAASFPPGIVREVSAINLPRHSRSPLARVVRNAARLARRVPPLVDRFAGFAPCVSQLLRGRAYQLAVVEHFWCAPYWEQIEAHCRSTLLNLHNIESLWHGRHAEVSGRVRSLAHRVFHRVSLELEREWLPRFNLVLATSLEDARRVRDIAPRARVAVFPNTIPLVDQPRPVEQDVIVFSGSLDYDPNRSAVRYFRNRIWPLLRDRWPRLRWRLVGRNPDAVRKYIHGDPRIECSGPVVNAVQELAAAKVAVVPLLAGSGTRLKIIEAWAAGRAVVSTSLGAEGLPVSAGQHIIVEDDPDRFAAAVSALLDSPALRERLGRAGRELYEREFTWSAAWSRLRVELDGLLS